MQSAHDPAAALTNFPASHCMHAAEPAGENWPAGQLVQLEAPVILTYVPAAQLTQVDSELAAIDAEYVPVVQPRQVATEVAPTVVE